MHSGLLQKDIRFLKGVGEERAKLFSKLGVDTLGSLVRYYPRRYIDLRNPLTIADAPDGEFSAVRATVERKRPPLRISGGRTVYKADAYDDTGSLDLAWFNNRFALTSLKESQSYIFFGKFTGNMLHREVINPLVIKPEEAALLPRYPLTQGLSSKIISNAVKAALETAKDEITETLPEELRAEYSLVEKRTAVCDIHFPASLEDAARAKRRLIVEELLTLSLGMSQKKNRSRQRTSAVIDCSGVDAFVSSLPFKLTAAQSRCVGDICRDLERNEPMSRLLQGDVGSGKTVVAAAGVYCAAKNGFQSAVMAPTEILARQHAETFERLLSPFGITVALLTGSVTGKARRLLYEQLADGKIDLLVGTHALLTPEVKFKRLGFVVADEQHRFGVEQRFSLSKKGENPHLLVMSATPIPRTMALIIYGDLDLSVIDELPPGRKPIKTYLVDGSYRVRYLNFVRKNVEQGYAAYIVCPLVEDSETLDDVRSATEYRDEIAKNYLAGINVGLLHGRMKPKDKEAAMRDFASGETPVLVSTTVIEVGVDVPEANTMIIENAERFGLSSLHQLRGRIGRGDAESCCVLVSFSKNEETIDRLKTLCSTNDGFEIARRDLAARGPGDFFGKRQHGLPELYIADLSTDERELHLAKELSERILAEDPSLQSPKYAALKNEIDVMFGETGAGRLN